jgi:hypothetical protein
VKSRGKRPSVYRILWKNGSDMGMAEGYNIAKTDEEFTLPSLIMRDKSLQHRRTQQSNSHNSESENIHDGEGDQEFQKLTAKFIANVLLLGKKKKQEESYHSHSHTHSDGPEQSNTGIAKTTDSIENRTSDLTGKATAIPRPKSAGATMSSRGMKKLTRFDTATATGVAGDVSEGEQPITSGGISPVATKKSFLRQSFNASAISEALNTVNKSSSTGVTTNPDAVTDVGKTTEQTKTKILDSLFSKTPQELDE